MFQLKRLTQRSMELSNSSAEKWERGSRRPRARPMTDIRWIDSVSLTTRTTVLQQLTVAGRKQVLVRHFRPMSTFSFVAMATSVWEFGIFSVSQGLVAGGRAGLFWTTVIHACGFLPIVLSMAEMSSIAPTAGGQYHWVSEFAHPNHQRWLSYITGWISTMAWQAGNAIGVFLTGTLIQVIILENNPNYAFPAWHGSLLVMSNIAFTVAANIHLTRYIPRVQTLFFCLHVLAFFAVIIPICVFAPKASAKQVFTEFKDFGGWGNVGFATLAGQLSAIYMMCGADSAAHIAEEVRDAAKTVPRSMLSVFGVNMLITFACWITIIFAIPDIPAALADPSLYPVVYVFKQSMSIKWVTVELTLIVALVLFANVCYLTAVSRDLFAFARDGGFPFSEWIAAVRLCHKEQNVCPQSKQWLTDIADPPQIPRPCQRSLRHRRLLLHPQFDLHRLSNGLLRHHIAHDRGVAPVLHVLHRLDSLATNLHAGDDSGGPRFQPG